ncbi:MAG: HAMP domain-containing protein [Methylocystaceae bacterium]|nr:HAMP domain-containing protein [Methylocystaceae bacterium]
MNKKSGRLTLYQKLGSYFGVRQKLIGAFAAVSILAVISGGVAFVAFNIAGESLSEITDGHIPPMISANELMMNSERLGADIRAFTTIEDLDQLVKERSRIEFSFAKVHNSFKALTELYANDDRVGQAKGLVEKLKANFKQIADVQNEKLATNEKLNKIFTIVEETRTKISKNLAPAYSFSRGIISNGRTIVNEQDYLLDTVSSSKGVLKEIIEAAEGSIRYAQLERTILSYEANLKGLLTIKDEKKRDLANIRAQDLIVSAGEIIKLLPPLMRENYKESMATLESFSKPNVKEKSVLALSLQASKATSQAEEQVKELYDNLNRLGSIISGLNQKLSANIHKAGNNAKKVKTQMLWAIGVATTTSLLVSILTVWLYVIRNVGRRLLRLHQTMRALSSGDLSVDVDTRGNDEISKMADAVEIFKSNAIEVEQLKSDELAKEYQQKKDLAQEMDKLVSLLSDEVLVLAHGVKEESVSLQNSADKMNKVVDDTFAQSNLLDTATQETTQAVSTIATAVDELASTGSEIQRQAHHSLEISNTAQSQSEEANGKVQGLTTAAESIGQVTDLISDIAEQTNLLALNATIEAARAGEAGKGFAVVASEVKTLADQTAKATDQISQHISDIQLATQGAADSISHTLSTITQINEIAGVIVQTVEEQSNAISEISLNMRTAADKTSDVSNGVSSVHRDTEVNKKLSGEVRLAADRAGQQILTLDQNIEQVIATLRQSAEREHEAANSMAIASESFNEEVKIDNKIIAAE